MRIVLNAAQMREVDSYMIHTMNIPGIVLMENAAMKAVADHLPEGSTTVGAEMNVTHIKPSGVGAEIVASAVLTEVEGRKLTFNVGARDAEGMIGEGVHVRYVVDREKFMSKVR